MDSEVIRVNKKFHFHVNIETPNLEELLIKKHTQWTMEEKSLVWMQKPSIAVPSISRRSVPLMAVCLKHETSEKTVIKHLTSEEELMLDNVNASKIIIQLLHNTI